MFIIKRQTGSSSELLYSFQQLAKKLWDSCQVFSKIEYLKVFAGAFYINAGRENPVSLSSLFPIILIIGVPAAIPLQF